MAVRDYRDLKRSYDALLTKRSASDSLWDFVRRFVVRTRESRGRDDVADSTAIRACDKLTTAQSEYLTRANSMWFAYEAPAEMDGISGVAEWYGKCTQLAMDALLGSNFYPEIHEVYHDRAGFGTGALLCFDHQGQLNFTHVPVGTFVVGMNAFGGAGCMIRELKFTAVQAVEMFVSKGGKIGGKVQSAYDDVAKRYCDEFTFLHEMVCLDGVWWQFYACVEDGVIVLEERTGEQPFVVVPFLKLGGCDYGYAPIESVECEVRRLQKLPAWSDLAAELAVRPRVKMLANQVDNVNLRPGGVTVVERGDANMPTDWLTSARGDIADARAEATREVVRAAFYNDIIETIGRVDRQMTATEVEARVMEKVLTFSCSFTFFVSEFRPMMYRIFMLLYRMGKFTEAPKGAQKVLQDAKGEQVTVLAEPKVAYKNRMSLLLSQGEADGLVRMMELLLGMGDIGVKAMVELFDMDAVVRKLALARGVPVDVMRSVKAVKDLRAQQEAAAASAAQMEAAQAGSVVAKNMGMTMKEK